MIIRASTRKPAGYNWLKQHYPVPDIPHDHVSWLDTVDARTQTGIDEVFPSRRYTPLGTWAGHLEFALKYDGINLRLLLRLFDHIPTTELETWIQDQPTGIYTRRIWFLYEFLRQSRLNIDDLKLGNYIDLVDPTQYMVRPYADQTTRRTSMSKRHRVVNNLLGNAQFCPMVRLRNLNWQALHDKTRQLLDRYDHATITGSINYLYTKETRSSFAIENETPSKDKVERFGKALRHAGKWPSLDKSAYLELQKIMLANPGEDYRTIQNYVGETIGMNEFVHLVPPRPDDVPALMEGLQAFIEESADLNPVIVAAVAAFGFVFIHPFEDGNGRTHRFMLHYFLSTRGVTPENFIFPVSATILEDMPAYDACLETFSVPVRNLVEYDFDDDFSMTVTSDSAYLYRYLDATPLVDYLYACINQTIDVVLKNELDLLHKFRQVKQAINREMDISNTALDRFVNFCHQNKGSLSRRKRDRFFEHYPDTQVARMEEIYRSFFKEP